MDIHWKWIRLKREFNITHIDNYVYNGFVDEVLKFLNKEEGPIFTYYENCKICEKKEYLKHCMGHSTHLYWSFIKINPSVFEDITLSKIRDIKIESILKD